MCVWFSVVQLCSAGSPGSSLKHIVSSSVLFIKCDTISLTLNGNKLTACIRISNYGGINVYIAVSELT